MKSLFSKNELRKIYKEKRKQWSSQQRLDFSQKIFKNYILQFNPIENQSIHIFLPIEKFFEIDTKIWIDYYWKNHIRVYIPKMLGEEIISIRYFPETVLKQNSWGIWEPETSEGEEVDFHQIITPLLYADKLGNRVGYGKGFYDRFFKRNENALKIGINYFGAGNEIIDADSFDVKLDYLISPEEILSFKEGNGAKLTK